MWELLTATQNYAFAIALGLMLAIALLEGTALMLGAGISEFLEAMLPDLDADIDLDVDLDTDVDLDVDAPDASGSVFTELLGWLHIGRLPLLIVLVIFLTTFGLVGLTMQSMVEGTVGFYLPGWIAVVPAMILSLPLVRLFGGGLAVIMPSDETEAVSEASFIGRIAVITLGAASIGSPAEAKLTDQYGHTHYVMVEPDTEAVRFEQGTAVLLTEQQGAVFRGIVSSNAALTADA